MGSSRSRRRRTRFGKRTIIIASAGGAAVAVGAVFAIYTISLAAANTSACHEYEDAYNQLARAVTTINSGAATDAASALADMNSVPARIGDASLGANGEIAAVMKSSSAAANAYLGENSTVSGRAFFLSTVDVKNACASGGAGINLSDMFDGSATPIATSAK